jgi:hypothetical protein
MAWVDGKDCAEGRGPGEAIPDSRVWELRAKNSTRTDAHVTMVFLEERGHAMWWKSIGKCSEANNEEC